MIAKKLTDRGKRVLQMGCDPKHDSVVTHFGGALIPTVLGTWAQFEKDGKAEDLAPEHIIFKGHGVYCIELGGPESARGCGGRGITFGFQLLEKWGLSEWNFNYMLLDFLGRRRLRRLRHADRALDGRQARSSSAATKASRCTLPTTSPPPCATSPNKAARRDCLGLFVNKDDGSGKAEALAECARHSGARIAAAVIPQDEVHGRRLPHPLDRRRRSNKVIDAIDHHDALVPEPGRFRRLHDARYRATRRQMDGTAVSSDELWSLPRHRRPTSRRSRTAARSIIATSKRKTMRRSFWCRPSSAAVDLRFRLRTGEWRRLRPTSCFLAIGSTVSFKLSDGELNV